MRVGLWVYGLATVVTGIVDIGVRSSLLINRYKPSVDIFLSHRYSRILLAPGWWRPGWRFCGSARNELAQRDRQ
jgi:hypothetical protein